MEAILYNTFSKDQLFLFTESILSYKLVGKLIDLKIYRNCIAID